MSHFVIILFYILEFILESDSRTRECSGVLCLPRSSRDGLFVIKF